jgi:hypothetical protein
VVFSKLMGRGDSNAVSLFTKLGALDCGLRDRSSCRVSTAIDAHGTLSVEDLPDA